MDVLKRGRRGADDHGLAAEDAGRNLAPQDAREGDGLDRPRRPAVVDPGFVVAERARGDLLPGARLDGRDGEALQPVDLVWQLAEHAARIGVDHRVAGSRADAAQDGVAAEDVRFARAR